VDKKLNSHSFKGKCYLGDLGADVRVILKLIISRVYTIQVGSCESTRGDARTDVSCQSHYVNAAERVERYSLRNFDRLNFEAICDLLEKCARAFPLVDSRETTYIVYTRLKYGVRVWSGFIWRRIVSYLRLL
jgi:hypothetical protein